MFSDGFTDLRMNHQHGQGNRHHLSVGDGGCHDA
jgi:hypothetical protein